MKKILFSLVAVLATSGFCSENNESKIFMDKFSQEVEKTKSEISCKNIDLSASKVAQDTNISDAVKIDAKKIIASQKSDKNLEYEANNDSKFVYTKNYTNKLQDAKDDILYDKKLNWGEQAKIAQRYIEENKNDVENNFYFNSTETIYIFISSSMPRETIINYLESTKYLQDNFVFVLRGGIGGIKKIKPTLVWIKELIGEKYKSARIIIDPRMAKKFKIQSVPAVLYTEKTMFELEAEAIVKEKEEINANTYIAYGDMPIKYALKKLNKERKNQFLTQMIRKLETR